ncbi:MAG TPA: tetratricopeptide repeat protein [Spirochaetota bacterium]|nr:tetratricopeptide repeat protein [Spirochaetota bacterium]HNT12922.1 tetratricopeptide repeat protein [Spirochaetota bacterium]HNV46707.1 tetratricopeptide repeat protein [Spirochaetota bacterium]HOS38883.1 tetratricopeptide repeat protein [Spirochaetota bacterium]HPI22301.1 tetratricopeptide repeat protein [Spirochaetota bacterium]
MLFTYIIIFFFVIVFAIFALYLLNTYVFPRRIDEIAQMIESGQTKLAIKKLTDMLEKDDRDAYAHFLLAEAYRKENNIQYAILEYRQVLKLGKFDAVVSEIDVRTKLAAIFKDKGAVEEAKKEFLILTKIDPDNYRNYHELGVIYFNANVFDRAGGYFKKSISCNAQDSDSQYYLGQIFYRSGNYPEAKQMFIETLKIDQTNYRAHYFLGLVLRQLGDHEWAVKEFEVAQKSDDIKVKCFLAKGTIFLEKEQYPKAVVELERGLKFAKRRSDTELNLRYFLAEAQEKMRDLHSAIFNWEKIVEVNRDFRDVQEKLKSYSEFRQDDRIKDFMIAGLSKFEHLCRKICEGMGLTIMDVDIISDTVIEILATETEGKWRNTRRTNRIIRIMRNTDSVGDKLLRQLHESMKLRNATRVIIISTGEYSQSAVDFSNTRPIELLGKNELVGLLRNVKD